MYPPREIPQMHSAIRHFLFSNEQERQPQLQRKMDNLPLGLRSAVRTGADDDPPTAAGSSSTEISAEPDVDHASSHEPVQPADLKPRRAHFNPPVRTTTWPYNPKVGRGDDDDDYMSQEYKCPAQNCHKVLKSKAELGKHVPVHCVAPLLKEEDEHHTGTQRQKVDSPLRGAESDDSTVRMGDKNDDDMDIASDGVENDINQLEAIDALINLGVKTVRKTDVSNMSPKTEGHGTDSDSPSGAPLRGAYIDDDDNDIVFFLCGDADNNNNESLETIGCPVGHNRNKKERVSPLLTGPDEIIPEKMVFHYVRLYIEVKNLKVNGVNMRMHVCKLCPGKAFTRRGHAEVHIRAHCGVKPYLCPWTNCRRRFGQVFYLLLLEERVHVNRTTRLFLFIEKSPQSPRKDPQRITCTRLSRM